MPTVSRRARFVDLISLVCILAGAALCYAMGLRLEEIGKLSYQHPGPRSESALAAADRARYLAYGGVALIAVGCAVGAVGTLRGAGRGKAS
jgi:hypothetical protein